jgi:hypothetical protein
MAGDYDKRRLVEWLRAEIQRQTGRRYDRNRLAKTTNSVTFLM